VGGLNAATLSRITRFTKPSVAAALDALVLAGLVIARSPANERRFLLAPGVEILPGLRPPVSQPDWVTRFGVALRVHRFLAVEDGSPLVRAIEARRLVDPLLDRMGAEAMPTPNVGATGLEFGSPSIGGSRTWPPGLAHRAPDDPSAAGRSTGP
jgi:hypothetical protein